MGNFSHLDPGTPEETWVADGRIAVDRPLDIDIDELVIVAAHPDDETLGAAGLMHRAHAGGAGVTVVIATDGEASHPGSPTHSPLELARLRRVEVISAVHELAPRARAHFLGLPDGGLEQSQDRLDSALVGIVDGLTADARRTLIVAPWSGDGHRDHRIVAESVSRVVGVRGIRHLGYPIWLWHWGSPDDVPWDLACSVRLSRGDRDVKGRALQLHASQLQPLSEAPGDEPIISSRTLAHFSRDQEWFFAEASASPQSMEASWFDDFYARNDDPWGFESRWYERRKRELLMAVLPTLDLGSVLEVGCGTGMITEQLSSRADRLLAVDASSAALESAAVRVGSLHNVELMQASVPGGWPTGVFDLIVVSEVGYYLSREDLSLTSELIDASLARGGVLVACHWRHPVAEYPLTGDEVHRELRRAPSWHRTVLHEEEDFLLEVFARDPRSVARSEGLV